MSVAPLRRPSVADELRAGLTDRILSGELEPGAPLREVELAAGYRVSRHTVRAALRALATDGLVRLEPNRGAMVARLTGAELLGLWELRTALEAEAARLATERDPDALRGAVDAAVDRLEALTAAPRPDRRSIDAAHDDVHRAIVVAAASPRIEAAYAALAVEQRLFLLQLRPVWGHERMAEHHRELAARLAAGDADAVREHLRQGVGAVLGGSPD